MPPGSSAAFWRAAAQPGLRLPDRRLPPQGSAHRLEPHRGGALQPEADRRGVSTRHAGGDGREQGAVAGVATADVARGDALRAGLPAQGAERASRREREAHERSRGGDEAATGGREHGLTIPGANQGTVRWRQRFSSMRETVGSRAVPPKSITPAANTRAPCGVS